jgi:alpha-glucosidase
MLAPLSGTLFLYQGQEIGMVNMPNDWGPEDIRDVAALNYLEVVTKK